MLGNATPIHIWVQGGWGGARPQREGGLERGNGLGGAGPSGSEGMGALSGRGLRIGGGGAGYGGSGSGGGGETGVGNRWASAGLVGVDGA